MTGPPAGLRGAVILLGVDSPIGLTLVRELGRHGVPVIGLGHSRRALGLYSRYAADGYLRVEGEGALVKQILQLAERHEARALMTVSEPDIELINRNRPALEARLDLLVPSAETLATVVNKDHCLAVAERLGIETPRSWSITKLEELDAQLPTMTFPVVLKWANPHLVSEALESRGLEVEKVQYARDGAELRARLQPYQGIGAFPLIQAFCPGHGLGQMFLIKDGQPLLAFQHRRIHEWPPEGGVSSLCQALSLSQHQDCQARSLALLRALAWDGVAMVEYRHDPASGRFVLMEINGRFWGSQPLAFHAGAHFAWYWLASRWDLPAGPAPKLKAGLRCRYMIPETYRLLRILFAQRKIGPGAPAFSRRRALGAYLLAFLSPRIRYYVFWLRDPKPFFADLWFIATKIVPRRIRP